MAEATQAAGAPDDHELVRRVQEEGDHEAVDLLLARYRPLIEAAAGRYFLRGGDREDLLQEARIGLLEAARQFDRSRPSFAAYATVSVHNQLRDAVRRDAARPQRLLSEASSLDAQDSAQFPDAPATLEVLEDAALDEAIVRLSHALQTKLSPLEREVILARLAGLEQAEIAAQVGGAPRRVEAALARARRKLRLAFASETEEGAGETAGHRPDLGASDES